MLSIIYFYFFSLIYSFSESLSLNEYQKMKILKNTRYLKFLKILNFDFLYLYQSRYAFYDLILFILPYRFIWNKYQLDLIWKISKSHQNHKNTQKMSNFAKYLCSIVFTFLRPSNFVRLFMMMFNIFCHLENCFKFPNNIRDFYVEIHFRVKIIQTRDRTRS